VNEAGCHFSPDLLKNLPQARDFVDLGIAALFASKQRAPLADELAESLDSFRIRNHRPNSHRFAFRKECPGGVPGKPPPEHTGQALTASTGCVDAAIQG
jgi:hypothetical protein